MYWLLERNKRRADDCNESIFHDVPFRSISKLNRMHYWCDEPAAPYSKVYWD
jgi:hypothetical protein